MSNRNKRIQFLRKISPDFRTFFRLLRGSLLYSTAVRIKWFKNYLIRNDKPIPITLKLLDQHVELRIRIQDIAILYEVFQEEAYALDETEFIDNFIDLGAHVGLVSLYYYLKYEPSGEMIMVEPHPENFELLQFNTNLIENKHLLHAAASDSDGTAFIDIGQTFGHNHSLQKTGYAVQSYTVDTLISLLKNTSRTYVKMDIEGKEYDIIENDISTWIDLVQGVTLEMHYEQAQFERLLQSKKLSYEAKGNKLYHIIGRSLTP